MRTRIASVFILLAAVFSFVLIPTSDVQPVRASGVTVSTGSGWYSGQFTTAWSGKIRHGGAGGFRAKLNTVNYWTGGKVPWPNNKTMHFSLSYSRASGMAVLTVTGVVPRFNPVVLTDCVDSGAGRILLTGKTSSEESGRVILSNLILNGARVGPPSGFEAVGSAGTRDIKWLLIQGIGGDFCLEGNLLFAWGAHPSDEGPALDFAIERPLARPPWDVNGDGVVDIGDVVMIGLYWGQSGAPGWIPADVNGDGVIDINDVVIVGLHWGETLLN